VAKVNVPRYTGYQRIPHPRQYSLPPSQPGDNSSSGEEVFLATFAHQLHCVVEENLLESVLISYLTCGQGVLRNALLSDEGRLTDYHVYHCLEGVGKALSDNFTMHWQGSSSSRSYLRW
jgi:hypothetical protein